MALEDRVRLRIEQLVDESHRLSVGNENGQMVDERRRGECSAWITSAQNVVHILCPQDSSSYRQKADAIASKEWGYVIHEGVAELGAVLRSLLVDAKAGMLASVADQARAEAFDDFLDHANAYLVDSRKNEAGVIAGVVFEDTVRRICRKQSIAEKDVQLDQLISALASNGTLSGVKAKRARGAAHVRTKASHAQWDEFDRSDVEATIALSRELIASHLDA
ncbi:hypothetical protein [Methylibium sp.]|jgi:hypothetical protein|uniref:hypothetical protein n=1 Tax=Methylibium sp. TaxID=2067992 RepID=UPI003D0CA677